MCSAERVIIAKLTLVGIQLMKVANQMIKFSLIIPTYNRPDLLEVALEHIAKARVPDDLSVTVIVSDNNSTPLKQEANRAALLRYPELKSVYLLATQQGRSHALNFALAHTDDEYLGFVDDDEKIDPAWFEVAATYMRRGDVDFIGGPYKPDWQSPPPAWLPMHIGAYRAVLGWIEQTDRAQPFEDFGGSICGGNCIVRRSALLEAGGFATHIGRSKGNLMGGEDDELHRNLVLKGFHGIYDPALIIYHFIPNTRMTRAYHLRWSFWSGASHGVRLQWLPPEPVPMLFGLPRYRYTKAVAGLMRYASCLVSRASHSKSRGFAGLMDATFLLGTLYGKLIFARRTRSQPVSAVATLPPASNV
jgi:GT2 family glycosyltransferase